MQYTHIYVLLYFYIFISILILFLKRHIFTYFTTSIIVILLFEFFVICLLYIPWAVTSGKTGLRLAYEFTTTPKEIVWKQILAFKSSQPHASPALTNKQLLLLSVHSVIYDFETNRFCLLCSCMLWKSHLALHLMAVVLWAWKSFKHCVFFV